MRRKKFFAFYHHEPGKDSYDRSVQGQSFPASNHHKYIDKHSLDIDALDRSYKSAIDEIISHLTMNYDPDDPRMYSFE